MWAGQQSSRGVWGSRRAMGPRTEEQLGRKMERLTAGYRWAGPRRRPQGPLGPSLHPTCPHGARVSRKSPLGPHVPDVQKAHGRRHTGMEGGEGLPALVCGHCGPRGSRTPEGLPPGGPPPRPQPPGFTQPLCLNGSGCHSPTRHPCLSPGSRSQRMRAKGPWGRAETGTRRCRSGRGDPGAGMPPAGCFWKGRNKTAIFTENPV